MLIRDRKKWGNQAIAALIFFSSCHGIFSNKMTRLSFEKKQVRTYNIHSKGCFALGASLVSVSPSRLGFIRHINFIFESWVVLEIEILIAFSCALDLLQLIYSLGVLNQETHLGLHFSSGSYSENGLQRISCTYKPDVIKQRFAQCDDDASN